jgi:mono/diheme cytochrome c family protein
MKLLVRLGCLVAALFAVAALGAAPAGKLEFNRDIRPILSENCFQCHGQDSAHREGKLRLDERENATLPRRNHVVIAPGKPDNSELIFRILSTDEEEQMPPPAANKHVTPEQAKLLRQWIAEGATYQKHWSFLPPQRSPLPAVKDARWPRAAIDHFVLARLEQENLSPAPEAAPETWLRRASFDLTGLPPTPAELDAFAEDVTRRGETAYATAVDRLLSSPHFGERLALDWLDAARYADSHGFNNDGFRTMWRWRDWVIDAFNTNKPYDQFITEQLAGDLLPHPTLEQRIATGFARNHVINSEGGIIDEEYRVEYVADRVRTLSTAWLGLTMECAKCHDHKFDPIKQTDFYRLFAFFNNVPEHGEDGRRANAVPMIPAPTREQQAVLAQQERDLAALQRQLEAASTPTPLAPEAIARLTQLSAAGIAPPTLHDGVALVEQGNTPDGLTARAWLAAPGITPPKIAAAKLEFLAESGVGVAGWLNPAADNPSDVALVSSTNYDGSPADATYGRGQEIRLIDGEIEVRLSERLPVYALIVRSEGAAIRPGEWRHVAVTYDGKRAAAGVRVFVDGAEVATRARYDDFFTLATSAKREFLLGADNAKDGRPFQGRLDDLRSFPRALPAAEVRALFQSVALPYALGRTRNASASARETGWLRDVLLADAKGSAAVAAARAALWETHLALRRSLPTAMVMEELPQPRPTFVLTRGNYDAPGEPVEAGVPEELIAPWPKDAPHNRLGLAQWLTQPQHPLTARVVVNRFWAQLFGTGIVKTLEDFGSQSEWPSHPEVLDRLARDFVDGGWNVKNLFRTLVLSATYRQSSTAAPALIARDPENRLLARGPRLRLPAELIRDQALAVSGLLTDRIGGASVYPYQPDKLYDGIVVGTVYPGSRWAQSTGENLYRRSLYTFWKRTVPHPAMRTFDAPDREVCTVRRSRTNTPLQALVLWNEPGYVEAARQLGTRMLHEGGATDDARVAFAFRLATGRRPEASETRVLATTLARLREDFSTHPEDAAALLTVGSSPVDSTLPPVELAAAASVASMILNLDETITKN